MYDQENQRQTAEALANLATATASDRQAFQILVESNSTLTAANSLLTKQLKEVQDQLAGLKKQSGQPRTRNPLDPMGYCWTHGCKVAVGHTSMSCNKKAPGHQDNATRNNMMGGSQRGKE